MGVIKCWTRARSILKSRLISDQIALHSVQLPLFIDKFNHLYLRIGHFRRDTKKGLFQNEAKITVQLNKRNSCKIWLFR